MPDNVTLLENRVEELSAQLRNLTLRVDQMAEQLGMQSMKVTPALESMPASASTPAWESLQVQETAQPQPAVIAREQLDASEELLSWADRKSLLPRLSTLCFVLVLALVLRTLTDSGIIGKQIARSSGLGMRRC